MGFIQAEALPAFIPDHLLKDVCITNTLGRQTVSLPSKEQACLLPIIRGLGSSSWSFLS